MLSFCRKSKPGTSSFTRKKPHVNIFIHCREITEGRFPPRRFPQRTFFRTIIHRHSVTSEMTSQYFPPFENEKFKACFLFTLENGQMVNCSNNSSPSEKCPGVGFHKLPPEAHLRRAWKMKLHRVSCGVYKLPEDEQIRVCLIHFFT